MSWRTISSEKRKARKLHRCIWCGQPIIIGENYTHIRGVFEGDPQTNDYHMECLAALEDMEFPEDGFDAWSQERPASI